MIKAAIYLLLCNASLLLGVAACSSPTPVAPEGRLVFERTVDGNADIYVLSVDGGALTRLTDNPGWDGEPAWSPDGNQIVFASDRAGGPAIYIMNADGSNPRALSDPSAASLTPSWSPDGKQIAFASTQPNGQAGDTSFEIWVANADGGDPHRVAGSPAAQSLYPSWGPKSDRLVYSQRAVTTGSLFAQLLDDHAAPRSLGAVVEGVPGAPAWSPDGNRLVYALERPDRVELWQAKPDGSDPLLLGQTGPNGGDPAWSPDGKHIVFASDQDGVRSLAIIDLSGNVVRQFPADGARVAHPDWHDSQSR